MASYSDRVRENRYRGEYDRDIAHTGDVGRALTDRFQTGIAEDPRAAFRESAEAAFQGFQERLGKDIGSLRRSQVGRGRLKTGYGMEDEDELFQYLGRDLNRTISDRALQAEGLNLDRLGMMGSYADRYSDRAMSARGGEYQTMRSQRLQDEADRRRGRGSLLSAALTAGGTILGGPVGGAIANRFLAPAVNKAVSGDGDKKKGS